MRLKKARIKRVGPGLNLVPFGKATPASCMNSGPDHEDHASRATPTQPTKKKTRTNGLRITVQPRSDDQIARCHEETPEGEIPGRLGVPALAMAMMPR